MLMGVWNIRGASLRATLVLIAAAIVAGTFRGRQ